MSDAEKSKCGQCNGTGKVKAPVEGGKTPGMLEREIVCPCCGGSGRK